MIPISLQELEAKQFSLYGKKNYCKNFEVKNEYYNNNKYLH